MKLINLAIVAYLLLSLAVLQSCGESLAEKKVNELLDSGCSLARGGDWKKALRYAKAAVQREPENPETQLFAALAYENNGDLEQALQASRLAVKADAKYFQSQYTLGRLCLKSPAKIQDSIEPLKRALQLKPGDVDTLILLAQASRKLGLLETVKYFEQLTVSNRYLNKPEPWNEMGIIYAEQNNYRAAATCFVTAYNRNNNNPIVTLNLAIFMDYMRQPARAVKFYRRFLELVKDNSAFDDRAEKIRRRINKIIDS